MIMYASTFLAGLNTVGQTLNGLNTLSSWSDGTQWSLLKVRVKCLIIEIVISMFAGFLGVFIQIDDKEKLNISKRILAGIQSLYLK